MKEKPFTCSVCQVAFAIAKDLGQHVEYMHLKPKNTEKLAKIQVGNNYSNQSLEKNVINSNDVLDCSNQSVKELDQLKEKHHLSSKKIDVAENNFSSRGFASYKRSV